MIVDIKKLTNAINKISDLASGKKTVPGIMLDTTHEDELRICYSTGHESLMDVIDNITYEEGDLRIKAVIAYEQMVRAINNCQPSGIIVVTEVHITYKSDKLITIGAEQKLASDSENDEEITYRKLAKKQMDVSWVEAGSETKSSILIRMDYDSIFEPDKYDTWNRAEFIDSVGRNVTEKGKIVYISTKAQFVFVNNQAHVCAVPISSIELDDYKLDEIKQSLGENYTEEEYLEAVNKEKARIHFSITVPQSLAKSVIDILGRCSSDEIFIHTQDSKFCNIFIDNESEKTGLWFEMAVPNRTHITAFEEYEALKYSDYQLDFVREFLVDNVKSAFNATKNDRTELTFVRDSENPNQINLNIISGSAAASTYDNYSIMVDGIADKHGDILDKKFSISLKVFVDMLAQLKTPFVGLDISIDNSGIKIRLSELYKERQIDCWNSAKDKNLISAETFDSVEGIEVRSSYRIDTIGVRQYTKLG